MDHSVRILHLEDMQLDAELVRHGLQRSGLAFDYKLVTDRASYHQALKEYSPDIIISDHSLPDIDSHGALELMKSMGIDTPFILVTATMSEEYAVEIMKDGACDYILKDRLQRLPNAVKSALRKRSLELEHKRAAAILRASERKYRMIFESIPIPMWMIAQQNLKILDVNEAAIAHYGYSKEEFLKMSILNLRLPDDLSVYVGSRVQKNVFTKPGVFQHRKKNGRIIHVEITAHDLMYEGKPARLIMANDITDKLEAENALEEEREQQQKLISEISIQVQERERDEIGKELHDNINQILTATKLYLEFTLLSEEKEMIPDLLQKSYNSLDMAIHEIRFLSHRLVAPAMQKTGLIEGVRHLINNLQQVTTLDIKLLPGNYNESLIDKNVKLMFYRIIQEQLNNIIKHARASLAIIEFVVSPGILLLRVQDNGVGFDTNVIPEGIGLRNINNRVACFLGSSHITSEPGSGCILEVEIPIQNEEAVFQLASGFKQ